MKPTLSVHVVLLLLILFPIPSSFGVEDAQVSEKSEEKETPDTSDQAARDLGKPAEEKDVTVFSLEDCIELGMKQNREFLREEEDFVLEHLSYELTRHNYGPLFDGTIRADIDDTDSTTQSAELSVSKKLFTGGDISLSASSTGSKPGETDGTETDSYSSILSLSYTQPLLKDAGHLVYREDLTSAERELRYAMRSLDLFKQQFLIEAILQDPSGSKYYRESGKESGEL